MYLQNADNRYISKEFEYHISSLNIHREHFIPFHRSRACFVRLVWRKQNTLQYNIFTNRGECVLQISELYCIIKKTLTLEKPDHHLYLLRYKDLTKSMYHVNASNLLISIILPHLIRHSSKNLHWCLSFLTTPPTFFFLKDRSQG